MRDKVKNCGLLVCNCESTMTLDGEALKTALELEAAPVVHSQLCRAQIDLFERAVTHGTPILTACTQEMPLFLEVAEETKAETPVRFVNIRERAGWCETPEAAQPKIAALIADAALDLSGARVKTITSHGVCLVYGRGQSAFDAAQKLSSRLDVSLVLIDAEDVIPPSVIDVPVHLGRLTRVCGALGGFELKIDGYAPMVPSSKQEFAFAMPRDGVSSHCDVILDLTGDPPLVPAADRRDGYVMADPHYLAGVAEALFEISDLVGDFEKPLYVQYNGDICAHGRSGKIGCTNCLDHCPVSAIEPRGDRIEIDDGICGGCGNCSASCPTGAVSYDYPARADIIARCQTLLSTYTGAGGKRPVLFFHDDSHGSGLISAMARFGRGLPATVLPLSVYSPLMIGHEVLSAAFASGAHHIVILAPPGRSEELSALEAQVELTRTFLAGLGLTEMRVELVDTGDPDILEKLLYGLPELATIPVMPSPSFVGGKREIARAAFMALHDSAPSPQRILSLPDEAPYGRIQISTDGCTLCLACVGACPAGALSDNPERPEVRFTEAACVQCGLCKATCPEKVIGLEARFDFTPDALQPQTLHGEDPFACIRCGKAFGTKSTLERVSKELEGKHWMFQTSQQSDILKMCDDCRVIASLAGENRAENGPVDPFSLGERPRIRTTDDYLEAEAAAKKTGKTPDDYLN